jgi:phage shock protein A
MFSILEIIVFVLFLGFILMLIFNFNAVKTLFGVGKAQAGKLARAAEAIDPIAMYKEKIDEATENLRTAKESLVKVKGLIATVERQLTDSKIEAARLDARIKLALSDNNEAKAADYVKQLQSVNDLIKEYDAQLINHSRSYQAFLKQVQAAQTKIVNAKRDAEKLGTQLEISKVEAEIGDINQRFSSKADPLDEAAKFKSEAQKQIDKNKARNQVFSDVNSDLVKEEEEDTKIKDMEAKSILEQYKKDMQKS